MSQESSAFPHVHQFSSSLDDQFLSSIRKPLVPHSDTRPIDRMSSPYPLRKKLMVPVTVSSVSQTISYSSLRQRNTAWFVMRLRESLRVTSVYLLW